MPRLIVFDLDGTLVDSRRDLAESANAVLAACGCRTHSEETIAGMVGDGAAMLVRRAFEAAGCSMPPDALERFLHVYDGRLLRHTRAYEGVPEMLDALARRATLAVLTNKPREATETILDGLNLAIYFGDRVRGGDGPHPRKPDPAGLSELMTEAGTAPAATLLVGDSIVDWRTARRAGVRVCIAGYGFGFHPGPGEELSEGDLVIDRPSDLLTKL